MRDRHEGRQTHYSAQLGALAGLIDWTSQMAGFWQSRFDDLEDLLKRWTNDRNGDRNALRRCRTGGPFRRKRSGARSRNRT